MNMLKMLLRILLSNEIDDVISAEIPDENVDKGLYDIVVKI